MARQLQTLAIPAGLGSLNFSRSPVQVQNGDLTDMASLTFKHDTWQKDGGASKINSTVITDAPKVIMLHDFVTGSNVQELVGATSDGKLITLDVNGIAKTLATGLGTDKMTVAAEGSSGGTKGLYVVNGNVNLKVYTGGASAVDVSDPAADWTTNKPEWFFQHGGRGWAGGKAHTVYASVLDTMQDYVNAGFLTFNVHPGEGEKIVGGVSWRGRAYFFKFPTGIYYLDDSDTNTANWKMKRLAKYVGAAGPGCFVEALDDVFFLSPDGYIHALSAVQEFGDAKSSAILSNEMGTFLRETLEFTKLNRAQSMFHSTHRRVMFAATPLKGTDNTLLFGFDLHRFDAVQGFKSTRDECTALASRRDPTTSIEYPVCGTTDGFVFRLDTEARSKDGGGYEGSWTTRDIELFPLGGRRGNLRELECEFAQSGNWTVDIEVHRDGVLSETVSFALQGAGAVLGSFVLGTDIVGVYTLRNSRQPLKGDARRVKLKGLNSNANENFSVASQTIKFTPGNDRI